MTKEEIIKWLSENKLKKAPENKGEYFIDIEKLVENSSEDYFYLNKLGREIQKYYKIWFFGRIDHTDKHYFHIIHLSKI